MSWEKVCTKVISCPCGQGEISKDTWSDDWNRTEDRSLEIHCATCKNKYKISSEYHCPKPYHDYTSYYCALKTYPSYCGIEYMTKANGRIDFAHYLAERFTIEELKDSLHLFESHSSYSKFPNSENGIMATNIVLLAKKNIKTQKIIKIKTYLVEAIESYNLYTTNKKSLELGKIEYETYKKAYYASAIKLNF